MKFNNETSLKTGMVLQMEANDIFSFLVFSDDFFLWFCILLGSFSPIVAWDSTCTQFRLHRFSSCSMIAHLYEPSQGLLCLQHSFKTMKEMPVNRCEERCRRASTQQQDWYLLTRSTTRALQSGLQWAAHTCFWPDYQTPGEWYQVPSPESEYLSDVMHLMLPNSTVHPGACPDIVSCYQ